MPRTIEDVKTELWPLRSRWLAGDSTVTERMKALAKEGADMVNAKAKEVAKKHGMKPRLTTADKFMKTFRTVGR